MYESGSLRVLNYVGGVMLNCLNNVLCYFYLNYLPSPAVNCMVYVVDWGSSFVVPADMEAAVVGIVVVLVAVADNGTFAVVAEK